MATRETLLVQLLARDVRNGITTEKEALLRVPLHHIEYFRNEVIKGRNRSKAFQDAEELMKAMKVRR
jgi:hypothetical protein